MADFRIYVNRKPDGTFEINTSNPFYIFDRVQIYADLSCTGDDYDAIMKEINRYISIYNEAGITDIEVYNKNNFPDLSADWDKIFNNQDEEPVSDDSDIFADTTRSKIAILFGKETKTFRDSKENNEYIAWYTADNYIFDKIRDLLTTYPGIKLIDVYTDIDMNAFDSEFIDAVINDSRFTLIRNDISGYNKTVPNKYAVKLDFIPSNGLTSVII